MLAVIEHASQRIRILGATPHPIACWVVQAAKNLVMDFEDSGSRARFLIRDRDGKFSGLLDAVLKDVGIEVVLSGVQMPRMNARRPPPRPQTRPSRRHPPRVPACRLTCTDEISARQDRPTLTSVTCYRVPIVRNVPVIPVVSRPRAEFVLGDGLADEPATS
jgi:hypothetical protein